MTQDSPGRVQAELPTEPGCRIVAELVRMPFGDRRIADPLSLPVGPSDAVDNGVIVGPSIVSLPGGSLRPGLPLSAPLRGSQRRSPALSPLGLAFLHCLPRGE